MNDDKYSTKNENTNNRIKQTKCKASLSANGKIVKLKILYVTLICKNSMINRRKRGACMLKPVSHLRHSVFHSLHSTKSFLLNTEYTPQTVPFSVFIHQPLKQSFVASS